MSDTSKYMIIYNYLLNNINNSFYKSGKIESENVLCEMFGVSRPTVRQAILMLENENLVKRVHGSGVYTNYSGYVNRRNRRKEHKLKKAAFLFPSLNSPIVSAVFDEVENMLMKKGCSLTVRSTNYSTNLERRTLEELDDDVAIDAILAVAYQSSLPSVNSQLFDNFIARGVPCLFFGEAYSKFPLIGAEDYASAYSMTERIAGLSHRNIVCLLEDKSSCAYEFYRGITRCAADHNINLDNIKFYWYTPETVNSVVNSVALNKFTVCICQDEQTARPIITRAKDIGISIPDTLSVVCLAASTPSEITSNIYPISKVGESLYSAVIMAAEDGIPTSTKKFPYTLNSGKTLGFAKRHNPLIPGDWADPFILEDGDNYYLYPTAYWETPIVYGFSSKDLFHWSNPRSIFNAKESELKNCTAAWAPSVVKHRGMYYLVFCDKENLVFCKSDTPLGDFKLITDCTIDRIFFPFDPHFIIENGRVFLTCGRTKCYFMELELGENYVRQKGALKQLTQHILAGFDDNKEDMTRFNGCSRINKIGGRYVLTWTCYTASDPRSLIRYAWADKIDGPYIPHEDNILLSGENTFQGVSHGQIIRHNGEYYIFYNRNRPASIKKERTLCFEKLHFIDKDHLYAKPTE